jgi:hypothetical protein
MGYPGERGEDVRERMEMQWLMLSTLRWVALEGTQRYAGAGEYGLDIATMPWLKIVIVIKGSNGRD